MLVARAYTCSHILAQLGGECPMCALEAEQAAALRGRAERADYADVELSIDELVARILDMPEDEALEVLAELPPEIREAVADHPDVSAARCLSSFAAFVQEACAARASSMLPEYLEWGPHIDAISLHMQGQLEDAERRRRDLTYRVRAQRMLISTPPRSLKSVLANLACAWAWARWPSRQIVYVSKNPTVVLDGARMFRDVISSPWYQERFVRGAWKIRVDQDAIGSVGNTAGGARKSKGITAEVIGMNADHVVLDDAHAMDDPPDSYTKTIENFDGNVASRLNDGRWATICAIMQRAGRRDYSEHALSQGYFHLRIPMEFEKRPECKCAQCAQAARGEPNAFGWKDWRTVEGEVLHPRYTPEVLAEARRRLRHRYAGQMQQRPADRQGEIFKVSHWRYCQIAGVGGAAADGKPLARPEGAYQGAARTYTFDRSGKLDVDWVCLSVDPTGGADGDDGSALGMLTIAGKGERRSVLGDHTPGAATWGQTKVALRQALIRTSDITGWTRRILVLVEKKALGPSAISEVEDWIASGLKNSAGRIIHARVLPYEPSGKGNKEARADFLEPMIEAGLLEVLDGADWILNAQPGNDDSIIGEFAAFGPRRRTRDDRVDCVSQCCDHYRDKRVPWVDIFRDRPRDEADESSPPTAVPKACKHRWVDGRCVACGEDPRQPRPPPATSCRCGEGKPSLPPADPRTKVCSRCSLVQDLISNGF